MTGARQSRTNYFFGGSWMDWKSSKAGLLCSFKYIFSTFPDMNCVRYTVARPLVLAAQVELNNLGRLDGKGTSTPPCAQINKESGSSLPDYSRDETPRPDADLDFFYF